MNDEFDEIEKELMRYRPTDVSNELMRRIEVQMHRPSTRHWHLKDRIFAATVAAGILATCINVALLAASFRSGMAASDNQSAATVTVQSLRGFEPTELAWLQQQALLNESSANAPAQVVER
jgi:hypothetical protein